MLIVTGVVLFMFKEQAKKGGDPQSLGIGEVLLLLSLTMDGLTGAVQVLLLIISLFIIILLYKHADIIISIIIIRVAGPNHKAQS